MSTLPILQTLTQPHDPAAEASRAEAVRCALSDTCRAKALLRRRYLAAAQTLEDAHLHVIAHAFRYTAAQEQEHEAVLRGMLRAWGGGAQDDTADAPLSADALLLLQEAASTEQAMADGLYCQYADAADAAGAPRVAQTFRRMAETDRWHAQRFRQYASAMAEGTLFRDAQRLSWLCLGCGQLHVGCEAPAVCLSCGRDRGHFIRSSYEPFAVFAMG